MNIKITGQHVTVTSSITKKNLQDAEMFAPKATKVFDEQKNEVFRISAGNTPTLDVKGAIFNGYNADEQLTISFVQPMMPLQERGDAFKKDYGNALAELSKYETVIKAQIEAAVHSVDTAFETAVIEEA